MSPCGICSLPQNAAVAAMPRADAGESSRRSTRQGWAQVRPGRILMIIAILEGSRSCDGRQRSARCGAVDGQARAARRADREGRQQFGGVPDRRYQPVDGKTLATRAEQSPPAAVGGCTMPVVGGGRTREISARLVSEDERVRVADLHRAGEGVRAIARELGRDPATVSRELRCNVDPKSGTYRTYTAQRLAMQRRARPKTLRSRTSCGWWQGQSQRLFRRWGWLPIR